MFAAWNTTFLLFLREINNLILNLFADERRVMLWNKNDINDVPNIDKGCDTQEIGYSINNKNKLTNAKRLFSTFLTNSIDPS